MKFSDPPRVISPSSDYPDMDEFFFTAKDEYGLHSVSISVPSKRTHAEEIQARVRAEEAASKYITENQSAACISLTW